MKALRAFLLLFIIYNSSFNFVFAQGPWTQRPSLPGEGRHGACSFSIGQRVYFGTGHNNGGNVDVLFDDWWEFDPGTNSWTQKASFAPGPRKWARAFSVGGKGYLGTGEVYGQVEESDLWEYSPIANTWTQKSYLPSSVREGACSFTIGNIAYYGTGDWLADMWAYDPANDTWTQIADYPDWGGTICASGFTINGKGYMGVGVDGNFLPSQLWFEYNPVTNLWATKANFPGLPRSGAIGFSVGSKGYIACGTDWPNSLTCYQDCYEYDPVADSWLRIQDFPGSGRRFVVATSTATRGYTCTGTNGINLNDMWEFDPAFATSTQEKTKLSFSIFPNPVHDHFTLQLSELPSPDSRLFIYDANGEIVLTSLITRQISAIQRNDLPSGVYFFEINSDQKKAGSGKLIFE
jgi:N-acetylneuraminic acid mutarotase